PGIKPACASSRTKRVAVLGTEGTVSREYTRTLIRDFANGSDVKLVGSARLAGFAEDELRGAPVADDLIAQEIAPCFVDAGGRRTDTVVLACTPYPLLLHRLERLPPPPGALPPPPPPAPPRGAPPCAAQGGGRAGAPRAHCLPLRPAAVGRARRGAGAFRTRWLRRLRRENASNALGRKRFPIPTERKPL